MFNKNSMDQNAPVTHLRTNYIKPLEALDEYFAMTEKIDRITVEEVMLKDDVLHVSCHDGMNRFILHVVNGENGYLITDSAGRNVISDMETLPYEEIKKARKYHIKAEMSKKGK